MTWSDSFKQGIQLFRQGNYEESLNKFNEVRGHHHRETESGFTRVKQAISKNSKEKSVYDSRAAAFEKLDRPVDALRDSKKGYVRSARLFLQVKKPEASLKMVELALDRLKGSNEKRRVELDALKQQALKDLEPPPCFFSKLPVEICSDIFALVADKSNAKMLALTLICRGWREIILNMPSLWRRLVLTSKTSGKKVDAWLKRSRGTLSSLEICRDFDFDARLKHTALCVGELLGEARELERRSKFKETGSYPGISSQSSRRILCSKRSSSFRLRLVHQSRLRSPSPLNSFTSVASICPSLNAPMYTCAILRFPNLEALHIERAGIQAEDRRCLDVLVKQSLLHLTDLRFTRCGLERQNVLISLLQSAPKLRRFAYSRCIETEAVDTVLTALAEQAPISYSQEGSETDERPICCPRLQHLDFTATVGLKAGPIVRLVKAHLPPADVPLQKDSDRSSTSTALVPLSRQLPIQTLILDDCDAFDADALPWLRAKVPRVSFKFTPIKKVRMRN
ncbi:hypothetical protein DFH11DRAFT_1550698 [Phellopilus nigrolimitatus]|nr:hypothetical protein DFH11DRAFT_1550698 [Phellopilus nigrolimitatus]